MPFTLPLSGALPFSTLAVIVFLVKATLILLAAFGITRVMQRSSAGARHLVWLVALGTLLLVPALTAWSPLRLAILPAAPSSKLAPADVPVSDARAPVGGVFGHSAPAGGVQGATTSNAVDAITPSTADAEPPATPFDLPGWPVMLLALWAIVALGIIATLGWAALAVRRIVRRAEPLDTPAWRNPLFEIADRYGLDEAPRLLRSDDVKMPFACGVLTPTIVLPAECEGWTSERRHAVLLHELAHVRRHDLLGHSIGRVACAAYWFHPLVWTAARALRNESERACDDLALSCGTDAPDYAEHLLDIVTSVRRDATPLVALAMARRKEFEGRMLAILDPELRRAAPSRKQSVGMIGTLALLAITVGAAAPVPRATAQQQARADSRAAKVARAEARAETRADARVDRDAREMETMAAFTDSVTRLGVHTAMRAANELTREQVRQVLRESVSERTRDSAMESLKALGEQTGVMAGATASAVVKATVPSVLEALFQGGTVSGATVSGLQQKQSPDERATLLAKVLRTDTSATLRRVAAWGLREYADQPAAAEALSNALRRDASDKVREMAAWALADGDEGRSDAVDALSAALKSDASPNVRATAAWALGRVGDGSAVDALASALGSAEPRVRTRALWAIGRISPKQAPTQVLPLLKDADARVRTMAAWTLYQIEDPAAVPALRSAVESEQDKDVQVAEIRALAALGEQSVDALRGLLESSDPKVKSMAVHALAGGHASGPWPWPWPEPRPYP